MLHVHQDARVVVWGWQLYQSAGCMFIKGFWATRRVEVINCKGSGATTLLYVLSQWIQASVGMLNQTLKLIGAWG